MDQRVDITVIMITRNEAHYLRQVFENICCWASKVIVVDSFSTDDSDSICREFGVILKKRRFRSFGDQWNFAIRLSEITSSWVMKIDPDEFIDDSLKASIEKILDSQGEYSGIRVVRQLFFMGKPLPVYDRLTRCWKHGTCTFSTNSVNEHPVINGRLVDASGLMFHFDSPDLHHWLNKQNLYSSLEALDWLDRRTVDASADELGRNVFWRLRLKRLFWKVPFRYSILFLYLFFVKKAFLAGRAGFRWVLLRVFVYRLIEYKCIDAAQRGTDYSKRADF